jgi:cytochrome P450 RapN
VSNVTEQVIDYPVAQEHGLDVDPVYRELQGQGPIKVRLPFGEPCWLATRYQDVRTVYSDRRFGKELGLDHDIPRVREITATDPSLLANMDPPRHTRMRKLTSAAFARPRILAMRTWIEGLVDDLLDAMEERGRPADFFSAVAWQLPNLVVTGILGVPRDDVPIFRGWIERMLATNSSFEERVDAHGQLRSYILELVAERRRRTTDDVLSDLVHARDDEDRLTEDELAMLCLSLFLGGFETTVAQLGSTLYVLMARRELWQELLDDPDLMPAALEELWRWIPSTRYGMPLVRWAIEGVELSGGVVIPAGQPILPERAVANRDDSVFPRASEVDFHRKDPQPHLSLGFGAHHCVGATLAHLELEVTLEKMLARFPRLELAIPAQDVTWSRTSFMRSVEALPLTW